MSALSNDNSLVIDYVCIGGLGLVIKSALSI